MSIFKLNAKDIIKEKNLYNIWLAGLGAYAKSSEEVNQLSDKSKSLFDELVERGRAVESSTKERLHTEHSHASVAVEERFQQMVQKFVGIDNERLDRVDDKIDQLATNIEALLIQKQDKIKPEKKESPAKAEKAAAAKEELTTQE
ncbi:phasin family protein [uncultured Photobacterium sp.]|uniref:phasin-related domain-containing protein n=1 Tax=uncultured Photobacterium sp. TaxID=173973 RepID=UPI00262031F9|nr:phasin family protein [uncultured Photobacterium sp.]